MLSTKKDIITNEVFLELLILKKRKKKTVLFSNPKTIFLYHWQSFIHLASPNYMQNIELESGQFIPGRIN